MGDVRNLLLLSVCFPLACHAQSGTQHYKYVYDSAGNIIARTKTLPGNMQNGVPTEELMASGIPTDSLATIRTDASWSEVRIEIKGDLAGDEMLLIYTPEGIFVKSVKVQSNSFTLNLSTLRKGTYLFCFRRNNGVVQQKYIKEF